MESRHRVGALVELTEVLRQFGKPAEPVFARAGIHPCLLRNPENSLTFIELGRLLQECVTETGCQHLGLLIGQRARCACLGLVGRLMQSAPTLGVAILDLCANQQRYIRGAIVYFATRGDVAYWGYAIHVPGMRALEQATDSALAIGANLLRELADVRPEAVLTTRKAPGEIEMYRRHFGVTPEFEAGQCALVFPASLLTRPIRTADRDLRKILSRSVAEYWALQKPGIQDKVIRVLRARVMFDGISLETAAEEVGLHPRTLHRRLQAEGTSFRALLDQARFEVSRELLRGTRIRVTDLALELGYADTSAFTHAFQRWAGITPSEWRAAS